MTNVISWLKKNKLSALLLLVVGYLLVKNSPILYRLNSLSGPTATMEIGRSLPPTGGGDMAVSKSAPFFPPVEPESPPTAGADRMVIRETTMSVVVKDVSEAIKTVQQKAESLGGYLIDSHLSKPEESASGTISIRVPKEKLTEALEAFRRVGLRVVDENISGRDVTDQFVDLEARLSTLNKTKAKFEEILDRATQIQDLLNVQRELINLQSQIDSIKGQQQYLSQSAKLSKVTVYLSTDEFSLPYAPKNAWRPDFIFKLAVRSLVSNFRNIASALIWIVVYSPIWLPIIGVVWYFRRRGKSKA